MTEQVSRMEGLTPDGGMGLVGYVIAAGVGLLLLPILPFVVVLWLASKVVGRNERGRRPERKSR